MAHHIEPALLRGEVFDEGDNEVLGTWDSLDGIDGPLERLADHAGIDLDQAARAMDWMREQEQESVFEVAGEMVGKMFDAIIPRQGQKSDAIKLSSVGMRTIAARVLMNRDGTETLTEWASRAGCSKQLLSWHLKQIEDSTRLHWLGGKRTETRATYAESARARWAALTPEERKARRAGYKADTPPDSSPVDQNLTLND
jgi:AraC-like DNA-binding protein